MDRTGAFALSKVEVLDVLRRIAPAEAATHVPHPNIWSWRALVEEADEAQPFVAFYLARPDDSPSTADEAEFLELATPTF